MIFVSHASLQVSELCDKAVWLRDGEVVKYGDAKLVTKEYENWMKTN